MLVSRVALGDKRSYLSPSCQPLTVGTFLHSFIAAGRTVLLSPRANEGLVAPGTQPEQFSCCFEYFPGFDKMPLGFMVILNRGGADQHPVLELELPFIFGLNLPRLPLEKSPKLAPDVLMPLVKFTRQRMLRR